ncbi:unnamed protein product, partial [marine sediment metagenome]
NIKKAATMKIKGGGIKPAIPSITIDVPYASEIIPPISGPIVIPIKTLNRIK